MSFNLLDLVKGQFNNDLVSKAASLLGENESNVSKAISGILPVVLGGLVGKGSSNASGATEVFNMSKETHSNGLFSNLSGLLGSSDLLSKGAGLIKSLLGDKAGSIIDAIAGFAGIKSSSASSIMSMAAPAALSTVGKHAADNNLSASGLMNLLSSQKSAILSALPSGLASVGGLLGLGKLGDAIPNIGGSVKKMQGASHRYTGHTKANSQKMLFPLLGFLALAALIWWFLLGGNKGCNAPKTADTTTVPVDTSSAKVITGTDPVVTIKGKVDSITGDYLYDLGKMITIDLPNNGGKLEIGENSTEAKLVSFLTNTNAMIDSVKGNWFEFTNVKFKTGSSEVTDASMAQLKNMVAIAKSFTTAKFKLGGYTDNTGDSIRNVVLSQKRADAVVAILKKMGTGASSIGGAKGYGPQWPIGDNGTAEGRAMNRRVAVNVKAK